MKILVISCSIHPKSKSRILAEAAHACLLAHQVSTEFLDMRNYDIPLCNGHTSYNHENVARLIEKFSEADAYIFATPIYNFDVNAVAKNLIEHTGKSMEGKVVAFLCAAGGLTSYMAVMSLANSLMLDFRCLIVPRFVYATGQHFSEDLLHDLEIHARIEQLVTELSTLTSARVSNKQ